MKLKDIWTEFLLNICLKKAKRVNRKPVFFQHEIKDIIATSTIIRGRLIAEIEKRLQERSITTSYLFTDNRIFEPFVDLLTINLAARDYHSFVYEIGSEIIEIVTLHEKKTGLKVNKSDLYFGMALSSIYKESTIGASFYWEMSQSEESKITGITYNPVTSIQNAVNRFTSAISPIEYGLKENSFYQNLLAKHYWIGNFKDNMVNLHDPDIFSYFSSGLRNRAIAYRLKTHFTDTIKMYAQELLNSLCILSEALLKAKPGITQNMFGKIIHTDIPTIAPSVATHIHGAGGISSTYPSSNKIQFDISFPNLITHIKTTTLTDDELKAHVIWGIYMIRNKALHDYDNTLCYYTDNRLFADAIGLGFAAVSIINKL